MNIEMPDGTIIEDVPEGITKRELEGRYSKYATNELPDLNEVMGANIFGGVVDYASDPSNLPVIGATLATLPFGGAGGAAMTAGRAAAPFLTGQLAPLMVRAGGGGALGGAIESFFNEKPMFESALEGGTEMAGAEALGGLAFKGGQKVLSPAAGKVSELGGKVMSYAKEKGLPFNPADLYPTWASRGIEKILSVAIPSRYAMQDTKQKVANLLTLPPDRANNFIYQNAMIEGKQAVENTGEMVSVGVSRALEKIRPPKGSGIKGEVEDAYDKFIVSLGPDARTDFPKLRGAFETIRAEQNKLPDVQQDEEVLKFISSLEKKFKGGMTGADLHASLRRFSHLKHAEDRNMGILRDAFKDQFEEMAEQYGGGSAKELLKTANKTWEDANKFTGGRTGQFVKNIASGSIDDNALTVKIFRTGNEELLSQLERRLTKEEWDNLRALNLENMLNNSGMDISGNKYIDGDKLLAMFEKHEEVLKKYYPKETIEAMKNLALYAKASRKMVREHNMPVLDFGSAAITALGAAGLGRQSGISDFQTSRPELHQDQGGGPGIDYSRILIGGAVTYGLARSLMNPKGAVNKWLTTGYLPESDLLRQAATLPMREMISE